MSEETIIRPESKCKVCLSKGWINYWDSKLRGTYTKDQVEDISKNPCFCLINQYKQLNTKLKPEFKDDNGQLIIKIVEKSEEKTETEVQKSEK